MLFRKKEAGKKESEPRVCETCGCLVSRYRAKEVRNNGFPDYYCGICAPPYDGKDHFADVVHYFIRRPAYKEEVTEEGKPIKRNK